jgi:pentapeptide MXKDX repeat protein
MLTNIINRQSFEFTCKSERTALHIRHDIESCTAMQFNNIIETIFREASTDDNFLKIDKLEIELGDVYVTDMCKPDILSKFGELLRQKILNPENTVVINNIGKSNLFKLLPETENEIQLIRLFILSGDVPWWVDKTSKLNIDAIIHKLISHEPETFKKLLEEFMERSELLSRLAHHINAGTFLKILESAPDLSGTILRELHVGESIHLELEMLSVKQRRKLKNSYRRNVYSSFGRLAQKLTNVLSQVPVLDAGFNIKVFSNQIEIMQLIELAKNSSTSKDYDRKNRIATAVKNLSVFQSELLLFELSNYSTDKNYFPKSVPGSDQRLQISFDKNSQKMIAFIMKRLKTSDEVMLEHLLQLDSNQLQHLSSLYRKRVKEIRERTQARKYLLNHPFLFKNGILKLIAYLSSSAKEGRAVDVGRPAKESLKDNLQGPITITGELKELSFLSAVKRLPAKDFLIVKDILQKGRFDTDNEKHLIKKMLHELKDQDIILLKFLAELPAYEIEKIFPLADSNRKDSNQRDSNQKDSIQKDSIQKDSIQKDPGQKDSIQKDTGQKDSIQKDSIQKDSDEKDSNYKSSHAKELNEFYKTGIQEENKIYIENAGLCLIAVYFPSLFKQLKYLENGKFKNKNVALRSIFILQYMVTGRAKSIEYLLQLNKLLCSFLVQEPILMNIRLTKKEKLEADSLIVSVIQNWKTLKNTSVNGFRESFLQRKGILCENEKSWTLRIEKKGYDILLETVPWSYNILKFPWMQKSILVEW